MLFPHKINLFYKLAQESQKSPLEHAYDYVMKEQLPNNPNYFDIARWLKEYGGQPFFKLEDWLPWIWKYFKGRIWEAESLLSLILTTSPAPYDKQIVVYLLKQAVKYFDEADFNLPLYWWYEKDFVPDDVLRAAQNRIIKSIIQDYNYADQYEAKEDDDESGIVMAKNNVAKHLAELINRSKKFSPEFLHRLAKHFGVDNYVNTLGETRGLEGSKIKNKNQYDKFDVAVLLEKSSASRLSITHQDMLELIAKSNDRAREYLRGFLYMSRDDVKFILDENMQPMDINYHRIAWPERVFVLPLDHLLSPVKEQWAQVFNDFNIIPNT